MKILMLGDSITNAGNWDTLAGSGNVDNYGMSGWTTSQLAQLVRDIVPRNEYSVCFYMAGINDFSWGRSAESILANNKDILNYLHSHDVIPVYQTLLYMLGNKEINSEIDWVNQKMQDFCLERNFKFLDLRPLLCRNGDLRDEYTDDGVHLTENAYIPWARVVQSLLNTIHA